MRKIRQVLRLHFEEQQSRRLIARSLGLSRDAVSDYITRAAATRLPWPLPDDMDDGALEHRLFPPVVALAPARKPEPDWPKVHQELKRKGATLQVLHEEYLSEYPNGIAYSLFCLRHREFTQTLKRYMRQVYVAGERVFVDYAGPTMTVVDPVNRTMRKAQVFVGVLGASNYIYAEAHWSQSLTDWIAAHCRMFEHLGAVPAVIVCDNLKSAVIKASRTDPVINATYQDMADHYGTLILPARAYKPKDKAKAENGVLIVERWIMFRLRKRAFGGLAELNEAIRALLVEINARPFQKLPGCRQSNFATIDRPAMRALPATPYEYAEFRKVRVGLDYRIVVDEVPYSVPFNLVRQEVELRLTAAVVEVLHRGKRVASHARSNGTVPVIDPQHMEAAHRHFGLWGADHALEWAVQTGAHVHRILEAMLVGMRTREQGYRAHNGLKRLAKDFGNERLNMACHRAIEIGAPSLSSVRSILRNNLDRQPAESQDRREANFEHPNLRGSDYYS